MVQNLMDILWIFDEALKRQAQYKEEEIKKLKKVEEECKLEQQGGVK